MKKEEIIIFRVTETEKKEIQSQAEKVGKSLSDYCRSSALSKTIFSFSEEEKNELRSYSRNLNQALNYLYQSENILSRSQLINEIKKVLKQLEELRKVW